MAKDGTARFRPRQCRNSFMPGRDELDQLLDEILEQPRRRRRLEAQIDETFVGERAVLVLDMTGFARETQAHGIVEFLLKVRRLRRIADPAVADSRGDIVKAEADNLFCLFPGVDDALAAARRVLSELPDDVYASIGIGYGPMLVVGDDDMLGNEVNLASKLGEDVAERGEILLTEAARTHLGKAGEDIERRSVSIAGLELTHYAFG
jgi:class 3 adenylate cyclase